MKVQAEISLYPLRTQDLSEPIEAFSQVLQRSRLEVHSGVMSTRISGRTEDVFAALQRAFADVASNYQVVLTVKLSNACPGGSPGARNSGGGRKTRKAQG